ncbi:MAG: hypothetical protein UV38_C0001G0289 [candidate division TM6 bacterium GW2011_GWE2_42_60]|nr:MAG: hypothetical protein UV38_C0001G0289 [candidate division TM6 bacterium GW2011_GWE2_42_60]HBY05518.1 DNA polymerase III subunit gamma/tau [Candidatus Dependentiae bacterium]
MDKGTPLNLARAWRPRTFDEMVGQTLVVTLLTNGLKRGILFPVYLLAGLRGSGKTSIGRVFACAVNCGMRSEYASGAYKGAFPCLECPSCRAMISGEHPDFIEIDAASHTGVDHVRQLIEEASFLPVMGEKKLYLIDEAHMLSKAAFNAFLKILEEPPKTVLFLLATTDIHKVLETVRSRSFQLFFDPIPAVDVIQHLQHVCDVEKVAYEQAGLACIAQVSGGSLRDALNLLERVRLLSDEGATQRVLAHLLGTVNDEVFCELLETVSCGSCAEVLEKIQALKLSERPAPFIWERLVALLQALIWVQQGLSALQFEHIKVRVKELSSAFSLPLLLEFLDMFYRVEVQFAKTSAQHILIERLLCGMTLRCGSLRDGSFEPQVPINRVSDYKREEKLHGVVANSPGPVQREAQVAGASEKQVAGASSPQAWQQFLNACEVGGDPMVFSVLKQGTGISVESGRVKAVFPQKFIFYNELLMNNKAVWQPHLEKCFGLGVTLELDFSAPASAGEPVRARSATSVPAQRAYTPSARPAFGAVSHESPKKSIDVSDTDKFKRAQELLGLFPGTITEVKENHE